MGIPIQKVRRFTHKGTYSHSKTFGAAVAVPTLNRLARYIKNQGTSSYCTAAAGSVAGSYLFGKEMSFEYQTAKEGQAVGLPIFDGADPATRDRAAMEYGFLPDEQSPLKFSTDGWQIPAEWQSYPKTLDGQAIVNTGFAPFNVYPDYQSVKNALISGEPDNAVVIMDGFWYREWQNPIGGLLPIPTTSPITRHDYIVIDFSTHPDGIERLTLQLSQGTSFGVGGLLYLDETSFNTAFKYPSFNGLGATIYRKGAVNPVQTKIANLQKLIILLGELYSLLKGV